MTTLLRNAPNQRLSAREFHEQLQKLFALPYKNEKEDIVFYTGARNVRFQNGVYHYVDWARIWAQGNTKEGEEEITLRNRVEGFDMAWLEGYTASEWRRITSISSNNNNSSSLQVYIRPKPPQDLTSFRKCETFVLADPFFKSPSSQSALQKRLSQWKFPNADTFLYWSSMSEALALAYSVTQAAPSNNNTLYNIVFVVREDGVIGDWLDDGVSDLANEWGWGDALTVDGGRKCVKFWIASPLHIVHVAPFQSSGRYEEWEELVYGKPANLKKLA
eukprot:PhF_6_TR15111/c0_g1_i2/m.23797